MMCVLKVSVLFYTCSDDLSLVSHSPVPTIGVQPPHQHLQLSKRIAHCERLRVKVAEFVLFSRALRIGIQAPRGSKAGLKTSEWPPSSRLSLSSCCLSRVYFAARCWVTRRSTSRLANAVVTPALTGPMALELSYQYAAVPCEFSFLGASVQRQPIQYAPFCIVLSRSALFYDFSITVSRARKKRCSEQNCGDR